MLICLSFLLPFLIHIYFLASLSIYHRIFSVNKKYERAFQSVDSNKAHNA